MTRAQREWARHQAGGEPLWALEYDDHGLPARMVLVGWSAPAHGPPPPDPQPKPQLPPSRQMELLP